MQNRVKRLATFFLVVFIGTCVYLSYIQVYQANWLATHARNMRNIENEKLIQRGGIYDAKGKLLAVSEQGRQGGAFERSYPYGPLFAHVIGFSSIQYGKTGLEAEFNQELLGMGGSVNLQNLVRRWVDDTSVGNDLILTLDAGLQELGYNLLGSHRGAVVVMNPQTGEILAMVSKPSFDPNRIDTIWPDVSKDEWSPLLNRATQGLYPPGSSFKIFVAAAILEENPDMLKQTFKCEGTTIIDGYKLSDYDPAGHGMIDLRQALVYSCNVTFANLGVKLGPDNWSKYTQKFGLEEPIKLEIPTVNSQLAKPDKMTPAQLAATGIGQGEILMTPLEMAMVTDAIANQGVIMQPYLVGKIRDSRGKTVKEFFPQALRTPISAETAQQVKEMMVGVVDQGTGQAARLPGIKVAGKTGTAENPQGQSHAWFVGFAPADQPKVLVAVIVENAGTGGQVAAPIARQLIDYALR